VPGPLSTPPWVGRNPKGSRSFPKTLSSWSISRSKRREPARIKLDADIGDVHADVPFPGLGINLLADPRHVGVGAALGHDVFQLLVGLQLAPQFQPGAAASRWRGQMEGDPALVGRHSEKVQSG